MVSSVAKKSPRKKASGNLPQIEDAALAVPQIQESSQTGFLEAAPFINPNAKRFFQSPPAEYAPGANDAAAALVTKKAVTFKPAASQTGGEKGADWQEALRMAIKASREPLMIEKGIRLEGSEEELALLREAVAQVNESLPDGKKLFIVDGRRAPQNVAARAFTQSAGPQSALKKSGMLTRLFARFRPETAAKKEPVPAIAGNAEIVKPEAKKARAGIIGGILRRALDLAKPESIPFSVSRRNAVGMGAGAAVALITGAALLQPKSTDVAGGIRGAQKMARARQEEQEPEQTLQESRETFEHQREEQDAQEKRELEAKDAFREKQAEQADQEKQAELKKQAKQDLQVRREENKHLKKEAAQPKKKPETKAQKAERLKQERARHQHGNNSRVAVKGEITFVNPHNGERMTAGLRGLRSCCGEFNKLARDWRRNKIINIDPKLLDYVERICGVLQSQGKQVRVVNVWCGYRSPETNQQLIAESKRRNGGRSGVAQNSYHLYGRALDISIKGVSIAELYNAACLALGNSGGVRRYQKNNFVHVDTRDGYHRCVVS